MRIVLVTRRCWPAIGGVERVVDELAREFVLGGHEVSIVAQRVDSGPQERFIHVLREAPSFRAFERSGASVRQFRLPRRRRALLFPLAYEGLPIVWRYTARRGRWWTARLHARAAAPALDPLLADADVVHVLGGDFFSAAVVDWCRRSGVPVLVSPFAHPGHWGDDGASVRSYRRADRVVATLEADADSLRGMGVEEDRLEICGVPCPGPAPASPQLTSGQVPDGRPVVLFLGERRPLKGVDLFLDAARLAWEQQPELYFALVGPGPPPPLRDRRVLDVGAVTDEQRSAWLDRADILVLPSKSESFGMVVVEAWSARTPVVVADLPALRELVTGCEGGLVVPRDPSSLAEGILTLTSDPARRRAMGERGYELWRSRYTPDEVARRHLTLYAEVMREHRRTG